MGDGFTSSGCTRSHIAQHLLGCAAVSMSPMVTSNTPRFLEINMAKHGETLVLCKNSPNVEINMAKHGLNKHLNIWWS